MRGLKQLPLWLTPPLLLSCALVLQSRPGETEPEAPRPTVNHALHQERELLCIDCHDPEETGTPKMPEAALCFECHEKLEEENERVQAYFAATRQADGSYRFAKLPYSEDIIVNHEGHAEKEVACADCHGEATEKAFSRPAPLDLKATCMGCHEQRGASNDCAVCHKETRKDVKPATHDERFLAEHGKEAPAGWREGEGASCALCHEVPQSCNACHQKTPPANHAEAGFRSFHGRDVDLRAQPFGDLSCALCHEEQSCNLCHQKTLPKGHEEAGFRFFHGRGDTDADEQPFRETSCALCHEEQSCVRCHQVSEPRNHTNSFKRRLHGITAEVERQSCQTCHKQDWCLSCHQTTQPLTHRGSWGTGQQNHCLACHEPLNSSGCFVCHKNTLGHLGQSPPPADANHLGASDPADCRSCHRVLPHLDDGGRCRRCHR